MSEYDKRQLIIMLNKIHSYKKGQIYLLSIINDLDGLLNVLSFNDTAWKKEFIYEWGNLEQVYAVALNEEKTSLDLDDQKIVIEAIDNLEKMVKTKLNSFEIENDIDTTYNDNYSICKWEI